MPESPTANETKPLTSQSDLDRTEQARDLTLVRLMARRIGNQEHFQHILQSASPELRAGVYKQLKPMLRFKAKAWHRMKFNDPIQ